MGLWLVETTCFNRPQPPFLYMYVVRVSHACVFVWGVPGGVRPPFLCLRVVGMPRGGVFVVQGLVFVFSYS